MLHVARRRVPREATGRTRGRPAQRGQEVGGGLRGGAWRTRGGCTWRGTNGKSREVGPGTGGEVVNMGLQRGSNI